MLTHTAVGDESSTSGMVLCSTGQGLSPLMRRQGGRSREKMSKTDRKMPKVRTKR